MKSVAIHQSQYIPWVPYIKKIAGCDIFVVMDNVQYQKNGVQNRNQIRNKNGEFWLTIPVSGNITDLIQDKKLASDAWRNKHWKSIVASYAHSPYWYLYKDGLQVLYNSMYTNLLEVNQAFLSYLLKIFNIKTEIVLLSQLRVDGQKSDLVLQICKVLGASSYISGTGSKSYLSEQDFMASNITINYIESIPPVYNQFNGEDSIPGLSIIDMMFNVDLDHIINYLNGGQWNGK